MLRSKVVVKENCNALRDQLDRLGLGSPYIDEFNVAGTLNDIMKNQGNVVRDNLSQSLELIVQDVKKMRDNMLVDMKKSSNAMNDSFALNSSFVAK